MANKLYEESSVRAIADALRLKRNGSTDTYTIADMDDGALSLPFGGIPSYHRAEAGRVIKEILSLKDRHTNSIVIGTISDNHVDLSVESAKTSARHAIYALETVGGMACDFVANLGDNVVGKDIDNDTDYANAVYMENASRYAMTDLVSYNLVGNHCKSNSTQKIYNLIGKYNSFDDYGTTQIRGYGYKDYADKKVRVIVLNTCDYWNGQGGNGISYEQKDFLMRSLDLSSKSDYAEWTIIILSHIPLDFLGGDYNKGADLKAILKAYDSGTSVSITVNSTYASAQNEADKYSGTLTYDYSGKNTPRIINIHGHVHTNTYGHLTFIDDNTELGIVRIATPNSSFSGNASTDRYAEYGNYSITTSEANKIKKYANTKADTSATFYLFDLDNQFIYSIGYGADIDRRSIYYGYETRYSVTYNLTNVTCSSVTTSVAEEGLYSTSITAIEDAILSKVTVTMGGVDITSTAYNSSTNMISIGGVTGDIVIEAVAELPLVTETITPHIAPRSTWYNGLGADGTLVLNNSNTECALGVSTANDYAYTDRAGNTFYLMPINSKYCDATLNYSATDGLDVTYYLQAIKDNGGTFTSVATVNKGKNNVITWDRGSADYLLISIEHTDGETRWDWSSTGKTITVTFTNGGTENGGDSGGDNTPTYTNIIDEVGTEDNVRLRSGGATGSAAGFASNYFPVKGGDVIRVQFPNGNRASIPSNGVYCCLYSDTSGTLVAAYDGSTTSSVLKNAADTGYEIHIPASVSCSYARVAGGPNGAYADWIVTVNEEIE